jgi:phage baseplate assembly protein W
MKRYNAFYFGMKADLTEPGGDGLALSPSGGLAMVDGHLSIRQSILTILSTVPGERVLRPDFGCDLYKLVFSPNDDTTAGLAIHYVRKALERWEKRITITRLDAGPHPTHPEILEITMSYRINSTMKEDHMTYAFDTNGKEA